MFGRPSLETKKDLPPFESSDIGIGCTIIVLVLATAAHERFFVQRRLSNGKARQTGTNEQTCRVVCWGVPVFYQQAKKPCCLAETKQPTGTAVSSLVVFAKNEAEM